jgi:DNA-directed RNA polymerase subunit RPC12/RpoP
MVRVRCPKCGYEWETRSRLAYTTCPNCLRKVRVVPAPLLPRSGGLRAG